MSEERVTGTEERTTRGHRAGAARAARPRGSDARTVQRACPVHGLTTFVKYSATDHHRCEQCRKDRVVARRRKVKALLVEEAGGRCVLCGYERYTGALQCVRRRKCVLLCANCHAEVEAGVAAVR